jgi:DNA-binding IscR family transcriptional regulator
MLSKKTQYAFKALTYMAEQKNVGPFLIAEIAEKKKIPLKFLESILLGIKKSRNFK